MTEGGSLNGSDTGWETSGELHAPPPPAARYEIRPLSTGEILDRTFLLYRSRFWLYVGLSSLAAGMSVLGSVGKLAYLHFQTGGAVGGRAAAVAGVVAMVGLVLTFIAYSVTQAATVSAVSSVYLGEETSIGAAFGAVRGRWLRYCLIAVWQGWSASWIFVLMVVPAIAIPAMGIRSAGLLVGTLMFVGFASLVYGVIAYLRNSLAIPAAVMEGLQVRSAMKRSKQLAEGRKGAIFLMYLLLFALYMVAGMLQFPFALALLHSRSGVYVLTQVIALVVAFLCNAMVGPVGAIALCLFYIDQRVRKEAFDIEFLMNKSDAPRVDVVADDPAAELA